MTKASPEIDLRSRFGSARDQGARPTCLMFAVSDAHAIVRTPSFIPLSPEHLYYNSVRRAKISPTQGITLPQVSDALRSDGQSLESDWPYRPALPGNLVDWAPPAGVTSHTRSVSTCATIFAGITALLDDGQAAILTLRISPSFYRPDSDGIVDAPIVEPPCGIHAVVAVGYGAVKLTAAILVRNSWGTGWGIDGHAWIMDGYLRPRLLTISEIN